MKTTTKLFIVLAATTATCLAIIGVAYGYYVTTQTRIYANTPNTTYGGFWGWFGGCLGFAPRQPYGYQYQYPNGNTTQPEYVPPQQPYQPPNPNQGYYPYGYGRGCWGW